MVVVVLVNIEVDKIIGGTIRLFYNEALKAGGAIAPHHQHHRFRRPFKTGKLVKFWFSSSSNGFIFT